MGTKPDNKTYITPLQMLFRLADTQYLFGEVSRGTGKSSEMLPSRMERITKAMPGGTGIFAAASFVSLYEDILPTLLSYFSKRYQRGIAWEMGSKPPPHFDRPLEVVNTWKNTLSFANGFVWYFTSFDRAAPSIGKNTVHIVWDEGLRIDGQKMQERLMPTLRQDATKFGNSSYFGGLTGFSSTPNVGFDQTWWLDYEKDMNQEVIKRIMSVAHEVYQHNYHVAYYKKLQKKQELSVQQSAKLKRSRKFVKKWSAWLNEWRKGETTYFKGSAYSNFLILRPEYIDRQHQATRDQTNFNTSILNIRQKAVKNKFFQHFTKKNVFEDSYVYYRIDRALTVVGYDQLPNHDCSELARLRSDLPLRISIDPGTFFSMVVSQKYDGYYNVLKNFYVTTGDHKQLAQQFHEFFKAHATKRFILDSDRAGNKKVYKNRITGDIDDTDVTLLVKELNRLGWNLIEYRSLNMPTITHKQQFYLLSELFSEKRNDLERIRICVNECSELISSINFTPVKKTDGQIEMDKTAEKTLPLSEQALYSPQIATALIYGLIGEYYTLISSEDLQEMDLPTLSI